MASTTDLRFRLEVSDDDYPSGVDPKSGVDEVLVAVRSINDPPSCDQASAEPARLWPPNHKMEAVRILGVMDTDSMYNQIDLAITAVRQDEPIDGIGDVEAIEFVCRQGAASRSFMREPLAGADDEQA